MSMSHTLMVCLQRKPICFTICDENAHNLHSNRLLGITCSLSHPLLFWRGMLDGRCAIEGWDSRELFDENIAPYFIEVWSWCNQTHALA